LRDGPSATANALGTIRIFSEVLITGKDASGSWYQISHPASQNGRAWISAAYVQVEGSPEIAVFAGEPGGTPAATIPSPILGTAVFWTPLPASTTSIGPAAPDGDSAQAPAVNVAFSPAGARSLQYTNEVSSPEGDAEDWVQFRPYAPAGQPASVITTIDCEGTTGLRLELQQSGVVLQTWEVIPCGERRRLLLSLFGGPPYALRLMSASDGNSLARVRYTLTVEADN
jgi:hypothetical protein